MERIQKYAPAIVVGVFVLAYIAFGSAGAADNPPTKPDTVPAFVASEGQNVLNVRAVTTLNNYQGGAGLWTDAERKYNHALLKDFMEKNR